MTADPTPADPTPAAADDPAPEGTSHGPGRLLIAVKTNDRRVPFLGYRTSSLRLSSYVLASTIATVSGALYPMLRGFVSPELLFFSTSGNAVITVILGGVGTLVGALYGSVMLTVLKSVIGSWTEHHLIVIGLLFMGAVIFFPQGLMGVVRPRIAGWIGKGAGNGDAR